MAEERVQLGEPGEQGEGAEEDGAAGEAAEDYGEVEKIIGSRVVERSTEYLIQWKDEHPVSWEPAANIANDLIDEYEKAWWAAARKGDAEKLEQQLEQGREVDSIDHNGRTALFFVSGTGSERAARLLLGAGADVHWQDKEGFSALHIAAGYVHNSVVKALLEAGANPEQLDKQGRSPLELAKQLLEKTPRSNPMQFARRLALDQVVKALDDAVFEDVEVRPAPHLDKRRP
eukprot:SM000276S10288  [mRNA]  locus=s276:92493:95215:+ [translate_table: standard]